MPLSAGTRLGPYEILAQIGAGGMGEVYRARDTKLDRDVAIKVLPAALAQHPERLARFEREAKVLAALNHPNIAMIHGLEDRAIVMELVEGENLKGPLPLETALNYAMQIADALEAAHEKGVVHRDLKPANVKVREDGTVKVLDFGLATAVQGDRESADASNSPTLTLGATEAGVILGTAAYMAPEQARGQKVDKRADIWAFGVVLYELLTGEQMFQGATVSDVLAQVLTREPDLEKTPARVRKLLQRCLEKDPKKRLRDVGEARFLLEAGETEVPLQAKARSTWLPWAVAAAVTAALAAVSFLYFRQTPPPQPLMRFTDDLGAEISLVSSFGPALAIAPDGSRLAYISAGDRGATHLSLRLISSTKSTVLTGTEGAAAPFFSPDSRWIGFFADQKLKKVSTEGGAPITLCDVQNNVRGASWGEDGNILFAYQRSPVYRVSSNGGTPQPATTLDQQKGEFSHRLAQLLPGGEAFLFSSSKDNNVWENANVQVQSIKTGRPKTLVQGGTFGRYLRGHLIYVHGGTVFAAPMDLKRLELTGPATPVIEDAAPHSNNGFSELDFTPSGTLVYVAGSAAGTEQRLLYWLEASGTPKPLPAPPAIYLAPRASPDGTRIAFALAEGGITNLVVYEVAQNRMTRVTFLKSGLAAGPAWTPDSKHLVFPIFSQELNGPGIYWIRADGAGEPIRLLEGASAGPTPSSFSPDGKRLAYFRRNPDYGIWTLPLDLADPEHPKAGKPELFLASPTPIQRPSFSPDGKWMAYDVGEAGIPQVYVHPFPGPGGKWQVSTTGGADPVWSRNGRELFYATLSVGIMAAPYTTKADAFAALQPRVWSEQGAGRNVFDLMPDGKRVIAAMPAAAAETERRTHVTFLLNFGDELQRRTAATGNAR